MSTAYPWINSLLEVPKVDGFFVLKLDGELALNKLPPLFDDALFDSFGPRVAELVEMVNSNYMPSKDLVLSFSGKLLCLRKSDTCIIGLLGEPGTSFSSLKLASNVALKQITPEVLEKLADYNQESKVATESPSKTQELSPASPGHQPTPSSTEKKGNPAFLIAGIIGVIAVAAGIYFVAQQGPSSSSGSAEPAASATPATTLAVALPGEPVEFVSVVGPELFTIQNSEGLKNVRLYGIDLPEAGQPYADEAVAFFRSEMSEGKVHMEVVNEDANGNAVAWVYTSDNPVSLNERLVSEGLAWHFFRFALDATNLADAQESAKESALGLWSESDPVEPWNFRRLNQDS